MPLFDAILASTDGSLCAEAAVQHALFLGRRTETPVHRVQVQPAAAPPSQVSAGFAGHLALVHDDPAAAILEAARGQRAGLLALGAHGTRGERVFLSQGMGRPFLGRTAEQIVRHAPCSVLTVRLGMGYSPARLRRILVALDASPLAGQAVHWAHCLATLYEARLEFLHVVEDSGAGQAEAQAREAVSAAVSALPEEAGRPPQLHVLTGRPERAIGSFASRLGIDLVVQGAHSGESGEVLGRVAAEVLRTAPCAVLTVRRATTTTELTSQAPQVRSAPVG